MDKQDKRLSLFGEVRLNHTPSLIQRSWILHHVARLLPEGAEVSLQQNILTVLGDSQFFARNAVSLCEAMNAPGLLSPQADLHPSMHHHHHYHHHHIHHHHHHHHQAAREQTLRAATEEMERLETAAHILVLLGK